MRHFGRCASIAVVVLFGVALSADVDAQEIRNYGDDGESSQGGDDSGGGSGERGGGWVPGQPEPKQSEGESEEQPRQQREEAEGEGEEEEGLAPSHRVSMYGGKSPGAGGEEMPSTLDMTMDQLYRGIIPGKRDELPHLHGAKDPDGSPNKLTWLGFRPTDDETRIFFQTAGEPEYDVDEDRENGRIELTLSNTRIGSSNFQRFIDTSYFERNVKRVEARETDGGQVVITIELSSFETPRVETDGNYVHLKFPHQSDDDQGDDDGESVADQEDD